MSKASLKRLVSMSDDELAGSAMRSTVPPKRARRSNSSVAGETGEKLAAIVHRALIAATCALLVAVPLGPLVAVPHVR